MFISEIADIGDLSSQIDGQIFWSCVSLKPQNREHFRGILVCVKCIGTIRHPSHLPTRIFSSTVRFCLAPKPYSPPPTSRHHLFCVVCEVWSRQSPFRKSAVSFVVPSCLLIPHTILNLQVRGRILSFSVTNFELTPMCLPSAFDCQVIG